jgi:hypothetical protein
MNQLIKSLYQMFLIRNAYVSEHITTYDDQGRRDSWIEKITIKSHDYTLEVIMHMPFAMSSMNMLYHPTYELVYDLTGAIDYQGTNV